MKTVFFDIDTQIDFLYPAGALYVPGAERIVPAIARLNRYAAAHGFPVVSDMDAHAENDPEFRVWPPHCVAGTPGRPSRPRRCSRSAWWFPWRPVKVQVEGAQQIIVEKQTLEPVRRTRTCGRCSRRSAADAYVVYGVVTEYCVRSRRSGCSTPASRSRW